MDKITKLEKLRTLYKETKQFEKADAIQKLLIQELEKELKKEGK